MHKEFKKLNIFSTKETFEASILEKPPLVRSFEILSVFFFLIFFGKKCDQGKSQKSNLLN